MRTAKAIAITLGALILPVLVICYGLLRAEGLSARKKPSSLEYVIANRALALSIPATAKDAENPMNATPQTLMAARKLYSDNCGICHGNDGTGRTNTAKGLSPEVPDLHADHIQKLTDGEMFYIIKNGVRFTGMPGWDLRDEQIWNLVSLLRQLANDNNSLEPGGRDSQEGKSTTGLP